MATRPHTFDFDLIVIGSGAGGSAAALIAAREGKKVAVVEADEFGGESPNWSDVPMHALLHAAHIYDNTKDAQRFGLRTTTLGYNYPSIRNWKDLAVKRTGAGGNKKFYENQGITALTGIAHFLTPHEITVNRRHYSARHFLIATGSSWVTPNIPGLENVHFLTPRSILDVIRPPKSLVIIGGGTHAVEIAELMAIFGSKVTIVEKAGRLLPQEEPEVSETIEQTLARRGVTSLTKARPLLIKKEPLGVRVVISRGGEEKSVKAEALLIAVGRTPNVDLGLENASVHFTKHGVEVNQFLQTSTKHIFATGDVIGQNKEDKSNSTQTALLESRIAAHNILKRTLATVDYTATPRITFTSPEVAHVGLTEDECRKRGLSIKKGLAPLTITARSNTSDFRDGFVKIIVDKKGVVLGGTIVAPGAAEMIHELGIAVKHNLTAHQLAETPHAFLTWSEAIRVAASRLV